MTTLQDAHGNKSSKRLWGTILLAVGLTMHTVLFVFAIQWGVKDPATASGVASTLVLAGSGLLGIGVVEGFAKK